MMEKSLRDHIERFVPISQQAFDASLQYFSFQKLKKNEYLIKDGTAVEYTYWIKAGLVISFFNDSKGKEHVMQFAIENCWITDQQAFYTRSAATLNVVCLEDSEILALSHQNREQMCDNIPAMNTFFRKKANDSFVKQQRRLLTYMTSEARERYDLLLREYPGLVQRVPKKILAAYLGVTRETLSRFR